MEGPSIIILKEELKPFLEKKVLSVRGNSKQPIDQLKGKTLKQIESWGKVLFLTFDSIVTKTHFMMFGSYRIDDPKKDRDPRVELRFKNGTLYLYSCSFLMHADDYYHAIDSRVDVMSKDWNPSHVLELMKKEKTSYLCDLFLSQQLFAGSGNIVKNEVLFNLRCHPLTKLNSIREKDWPKIVEAVHDYCWNFYRWKKQFELMRHWQVYRQFYCPLCKRKLTRENDGRFQRKSFFCPVHQRLKKSVKRTTPLQVHPVLPKRESVKTEGRLDH